jgi:hypothetical protein
LPCFIFPQVTFIVKILSIYLCAYCLSLLEHKFQGAGVVACFACCPGPRA